MATSLSPPPRASRWTRAFDGAIAAISLFAGFAVVAAPTVEVPFLLVALAIALMALGIREVAVGVRSPAGASPIRVLRITSGLASTFLGFLVAVFPGYGVATLVWFLFLGLFAVGAVKIGDGVVGTDLPAWLRGYSIAVGMLNLLLTPVLLLAPGRPRITLVLLISAALVVNGIAIIVRGWIGRRAETAPVRESPVRGGDP